MTEQKAVGFTPGPWAILAPKKTGGEFGDPGDRAIMAGPRIQVAEAFQRTADGSENGLQLPSEANARLIAAAPALYEVLVEIADAGQLTLSSLWRAQAALKLARGE